MPTVLVPLLLALDQTLKLWALEHLSPVPKPLLGDLLYLTLVRNTGAGFGLFQGQAPLLGLLSFLVGAGLLLLLAPFLPSAPYPPLLLLAVLGVAWLYLQARSALEEEAPLGPLVAVGLGAADFFFLGVLGLLLRPLGLLLLPLGLGAFWGFLRRGEEGLNAGARGP